MRLALLVWIRIWLTMAVVSLSLWHTLFVSLSSISAFWRLLLFLAFKLSLLCREPQVVQDWLGLDRTTPTLVSLVFLCGARVSCPWTVTIVDKIWLQRRAYPREWRGAGSGRVLACWYSYPIWLWGFPVARGVWQLVDEVSRLDVQSAMAGVFEADEDRDLKIFL